MYHDFQRIIVDFSPRILRCIYSITLKKLSTTRQEAFVAATRLPRSSINESLGKHQVRLDLPGKRTRLDQAELVLQGSPGRESLHSRRGTRQTIELCMRTLWGYTSRLIRMSPLRSSKCLHWTPTEVRLGAHQSSTCP